MGGLQVHATMDNPLNLDHGFTSASRDWDSWPSGFRPTD
jgi:hypothetical protein